MTVYVAQCMVFFSGDENWAKGNAQWIKDNTEQLALQASIVDPGSAGERSSYCFAAKVNEDGSLEIVSAWHLDEEGNVIQGLPE